MKQISILLLAFGVLWSCRNRSIEDVPLNDPKEVEKIAKNLGPEGAYLQDARPYKRVNRNYVDSLLGDICQTRNLEFIDLYPMVDSIASDEHENLVLVTSLKSQGFTVTHWSRGNWMNGPRIVSFTMSNQLCECQLDKLYYSIDHGSSYQVTERIKCKPD